MLSRIASLALVLVPMSTAQATATVTEEDFVAWVREAALPLASLDWETVDLAPLAGLDEALAGKRIAYLGEPDHFIREKMDYRLILIRYLHARGWRHVGMEQGRSDGMRIDRYLETGDEALLDQVAIFGYDGFLRADRDDSVPGWTGGKNPEMRRRAVGEARWFLGEMRRFNEALSSADERLTYFGFDVSMKPGGSYFDARGGARIHRGEKLVDEVWAAARASGGGDASGGSRAARRARRLRRGATCPAGRASGRGRSAGAAALGDLPGRGPALRRHLHRPFDTDAKHAT